MHRAAAQLAIKIMNRRVERGTHTGADRGVLICHAGDGIERCRIVFKPQIIPVRPVPKRAFQGWRYLDESDAPPDLPKSLKVEGMPEKLRRELAELGLL